MFTDKVELKDFEKQDPEYQDLLRRVLAIQADCEIGGPNLYVKDILPNAPTKLDQLIVARTAARPAVPAATMVASVISKSDVWLTSQQSNPRADQDREASRSQALEMVVKWSVGRTPRRMVPMGARFR